MEEVGLSQTRGGGGNKTFLMKKEVIGKELWRARRSKSKSGITNNTETEG